MRECFFCGRRGVRRFMLAPATNMAGDTHLLTVCSCRRSCWQRRQRAYRSAAAAR